MKRRMYAGMALMAFGLAVVGCDNAKPTVTAVKDGEKKLRPKGHEGHAEHEEGLHGGAIAEVSKYHAEFTVDHAKKEATVYFLDENLKKHEPIDAATIQLGIKKPAIQIELKAVPQDGEPKGKSSRFVGTHEALGKEQEFEGTITVVLEGKPFSGDFKEEPHADHKDHKKKAEAKADPKEVALFLEPGGIYTKADIEANGGKVPSVKYAGFKASHDIKPKSGDKLCPVTLTKSSDKLTWIVSGKTYEFCCPPCLEEFVELAKTKPAEIKEPMEYVKK